MLGNILLTGNNGYIGSVLTKLLLKKGYNVLGLDTNYYGEHTDIPQLTKDIRNIKSNDLSNIDYVIHLAALSNDPLGEFNPKLTNEINFYSTIKLAKTAKKMKVKRFIYSSSQSMYGISDDSILLKEDGPKNPITTYAKTKWKAECELKKFSDDNFTVVCFRPSTVFGVSPNLRCDIVYNNLIGSAYTTGKIEIHSDGSPIRPVIHIKDVSNAFIAGLEAPQELISGESFNIGIKNGNYTVREMAETAQTLIKDSKLIFTGDHGNDSRTYRVSFEKILSVLKNYYKPEWDLVRGGKELIKYFDMIGFNEDMYRGKTYNRILQLRFLSDNNELNEDLYWT